jgi:hypothetical protein
LRHGSLTFGGTASDLDVHSPDDQEFTHHAAARRIIGDADSDFNG